LTPPVDRTRIATVRNNRNNRRRVYEDVPIIGVKTPSKGKRHRMGMVHSKTPYTLVLLRPWKSLKREKRDL
jgi:hypothetical protein